MGIVLKGIDRILLKVTDLASATRYYSSVLGLVVDRQHSGVVAMKIPGDDAEIVLHSDSHRPDVEVCFLVDDVRKLYEQRQHLRLNFIAPPTATQNGYRAAVRDPQGHVITLHDRAGLPGTEVLGVVHAKQEGALFDDVPSDPTEDLENLVKVYADIGRTADDLPYTPQFETLYSRYTRDLEAPLPTHNQVWRQLLKLRKRKGGLPSMGPARSKPPLIEVEAKDKLRELLGAKIGQRDRLPYTPEFDVMVREFNKQFARNYSPHIVWRLVATLAK